jgi:D-amino-acid oxidase
MLKKIFVFSVAILLSIASVIASAAPLEVRQITPPKLESAHLGQKILCHRPMRHGSPHMIVEQKMGK